VLVRIFVFFFFLFFLEKPESARRSEGTRFALVATQCCCGEETMTLLCVVAFDRPRGNRSINQINQSISQPSNQMQLRSISPTGGLRDEMRAKPNVDRHLIRRKNSESVSQCVDFLD
jgi:hypothetical protein